MAWKNLHCDGAYNGFNLVLSMILLCFLSSCVNRGLAYQAVNHKSKMAKIEVINAGIGGNSSKDLLRRIDNDVIGLKPDLVILLVGTNDMLNSKKMLTYGKFKENLHKIVSSLRESGATVLVMSPLPVDSTYLFERHPRSSYMEAPNEILDNTSKLTQELAQSEGIFFLDLFKIFTVLNVPDHENDPYIRNMLNSGVRDGVHPTKKGYTLMAEEILTYMKKKHLLKGTKKIVCFGDSITKGGRKMHILGFQQILIRIF